MNELQKIQAKIDGLMKKGQEAKNKKDKTSFDEIQAKLKDAREEMALEINFLDDERKNQEILAKATKFNNGDRKELKKVGELDPQKEIKAKFESDEYRHAVLHDMMGKATKTDLDLIREVNGFHSTENTSILIPNTILGQIWNTVQEEYPLYGHLNVTRVPGTITYQRELSNTQTGDGWVMNERTAAHIVEFQFEDFDLDGHEFHKGVEVSFKMRIMSRPDFESYIIGRLAEIVGQTLSMSVYNGDGNAKGHGFRPRLAQLAPERIVSVPQFSLESFNNALAHMKSGIQPRLRVYANNWTIFSQLANIKDQEGHPLFTRDVIAGAGVGRVLGMPTFEAAELPNGEVVIADLERGMRCNINEDISVLNEVDNRNRITFHSLYMILDHDLFHPDFFFILNGPQGGESAFAEGVKIKTKK